MPLALVERAARLAASQTKLTGAEVKMPGVVRGALEIGLDAIEGCVASLDNPTQK